MTEGHPIDPIAAALGILGFAVLGFLSNRIPIALVATGVALALFFTGVLSLPEALAGFGDPTVLFIASLFVVSESLDATGVTAWAGQKMIAQAGSRHTALIVLISLLVAVLTALISVNGAVAALLPLMLLIGCRVLPDRSGSPMPPDLPWLATELHQQYTVDLDADALLEPLRGVTEVVVPPRSPLIGTHVFPGMR
ncbi:SLC13 family permease [Microbacterium sp. YY-03]|uniref:SLC13 family permease n=1 Tax=Microbacterium sp. YY-03 TaxID=3421636 RepID=UPI003D174EC0